MKSKLPRKTVTNQFWMEVTNNGDSYTASIFEKGYENDWHTVKKPTYTEAKEACLKNFPIRGESVLVYMF